MKTAKFFAFILLIIAIAFAVMTLSSDLIYSFPAVIAYIAYRLLNDCIKDLESTTPEAATREL